MTGNQEIRMSPSSWQRSDLNTGIPIKKRKFLMWPASPPSEKTSLTPLENSSQPKEQDSYGIGSSLSCSLDVNKQTLPEEESKSASLIPSVADEKLIDQPGQLPCSFQSTEPGEVKSSEFVSSSAEAEMKLARSENIVQGLLPNREMKTEELDFPSSVSFSDIEKRHHLGNKPSGSERTGSSVQSFSLASYANKERIMEAERPGVVVRSGKVDVQIDRTVLAVHGMIGETCDKENVKEGCQIELSSRSSDKLSFGSKINTVQYKENEGSLALNLSISKEGSPAQNSNDVSVTKAGGSIGINRSNWDLNTTMDAWNDAQDVTTVGKANISFLSNKNSPLATKPPSTFDSNSVSEEQKVSLGSKADVVTSMQLNRRDNPGCSLSLGLGSDPPIERPSPLSSTSTLTGSVYTSSSRRMITTDSDKIEIAKKESGNYRCYSADSSGNRVKRELAEKHSQASSSSKLVDPASIKAEPVDHICSETVYKKDGTSNQPIIQPKERLDVPTCSTSNQGKSMPCATGYRRQHVSLTRMSENPSDLNHSKYRLLENSAQISSEAHGIVHKTLKQAEADTISTYFGKGLPLNSRGTDDSSLSDEERVNLSGDMIEEEDVYGSDFESDGAHLSKLKNKQYGRINKGSEAQGSLANKQSACNKSKMEHAECSNSGTKNMNMTPLSCGGFQNSICVDEQGNRSAGNEHLEKCFGTSIDTKLKISADEDSCATELVEMSNEIKKLIPDPQRRRTSDESRDKEDEIIWNNDHLSCRVIHASNVENSDIVDKSSPGSYRDDDPQKEFSGGDSHSRVINLARVSKTREASGSFAPSSVERQRLSDISLEARKSASRGRDEAFDGEPYKFPRERYNEHFGNRRLNFMPDRRRFSSRTEINPRDRDSDPMNADFEFDNYDNGHENGGYVRSFHRGKRSWNDEADMFPPSFSRRRPPGYSYTQRGPRNSEDKFSRSLPRNNMDSMDRPQRPYEDFDGCFVREQRNFSNNHKRYFPTFHSGSPSRSRGRSPRPCPSFRNRSPDGFLEHSEFHNRRTSPNCRMRSPNHSGFRRSSPPYSSRPSNVYRGVGPGRGRGGYRRSGISFRNQPDHVYRNSGKFSMMDSRERDEYGEGFFQGPNRSDRFGEFGVDLHSGRKFVNRHESSIHSFRPSFNTNDCVPNSTENNPDVKRFGREGDADIEGRGKLREFGRQNSNCAENASGRCQNLDEKEDKSKQSGDGFDGDQIKKKS